MVMIMKMVDFESQKGGEMSDFRWLWEDNSDLVDMSIVTWYLVLGT
jgi:hypothetical protein